MSVSSAERDGLIRAAFEGKLYPPDALLMSHQCSVAKDRAYSPYSHFPVGAALLAKDGAIIRGCSVDNVIYSETICAERVAIVKAVSDGVTDFRALAVTSNLFSAITPCGLCRQVLHEFCDPRMAIFLVPGDYPSSDVRETTLGKLFPALAGHSAMVH
ncbi:cytidine deaminase [Guyanagaster necrorhizus]|uniref:Cytidine deaminase n=1 Tax=Guyanagaster necrorhizus TaxID=856835 RepID=A0A9P7VNT5_9AGAR|nr:cytidine deaminase [Guyanagaster necrorhizus MCA 3950]KAG7443877.1 cytidine deaminase [Guyanagaster necrorhizus MCA 3950]